MKGISVFNHCHIVGEIARNIINLYPEDISSNLFPAGSEMAAAAHDIGKVSPSFVAKILRACGEDFRTFPELAEAEPALETQWGGHAGVSQATAEELKAPEYVAEILGQHHGFNPNVDDKRGDAEVFGGPAWLEERKRLVAALKACLDADWPTFEQACQARVVAGLTSVADWIGSGEFFEDPMADWKPNITAALHNAGFINPVIQTGLSFSEVFDPKNRRMQPYKAQSVFLDQISGPGVYVLEAQMGTGKTEAALYAAYQLLAAKKATGIYFALPTQLTSNKIYDRFNKFLEQIISSGTPGRALLLHSGAWMLIKKSEMGEEGCPGGAWFNQNKRGLLAPFAVGTIDQALMAVMNVKHGFVRAFGLAGKVVILDEVHSYDLYTGTILNKLVDFLRQIECTVIILSATLSQSRRNALLQQETASSDYPLVTAVAADKAVIKEVAVPAANDASITVKHCDEEVHALEEALARAQQGQQVLWIENTVADAQERYLDVASRAVQSGCEVGLLHSRFTPQDRAAKETHWVDLFGGAGWSQRGECGRILVGTQVLEQSLDIDADFLISRFAPTDMLLQRIGRLWRNAATPRHPNASPECWLLMPNLERALNDPRSAFGLSASVYFPYVLCRSLEVWQGLTTIMLPSGIRSLIDQTYCERSETGQWASLLHELKQGSRFRTGEETQQALAKLTLSKGGKTLPEHKAETRYSDQDTHDVLLLRSLRSQNGETYLRLLDDRELILPHKYHKLNKAGWRSLAVALNQQLVKVNPNYCPEKIAKRELEKWHLHKVFYLGRPEDDESLLRIALVDSLGKLCTLDGSPSAQKDILEYRDDLGYRVITNEE